MRLTRRTRNRLLAWGLLPALLCLLFAGKVGLMLSADAAGRLAYEQGDFAVAQQEFASNDRLNLFEPWKARFNEGDARYQQGDHVGAVSRFEAALTDVPHEHDCTVRINLALTHERVGDLAAEGADRAAAVQAWQAGRDTLAAGDCPTDAGGGPEQAGTARVVDERLRRKIEEPPTTEPPPPQEQPAPEEPAPPQEPQQDERVQELEERNSDGEEYRREVEDLEESPFDGWSPDYEW